METIGSAIPEENFYERPVMQLVREIPLIKLFMTTDKDKIADFAFGQLQQRISVLRANIPELELLITNITSMLFSGPRKISSESALVGESDMSALQGDHNRYLARASEFRLRHAMLSKGKEGFAEAYGKPYPTSWNNLDGAKYRIKGGTGLNTEDPMTRDMVEAILACGNARDLRGYHLFALDWVALDADRTSMSMFVTDELIRKLQELGIYEKEGLLISAKKLGKSILQLAGRLIPKRKREIDTSRLEQPDAEEIVQVLALTEDSVKDELSER
jgi:hypothetical protein